MNPNTGELFLDDWDVHEGEMARLAAIVANCSSDDAGAHAQCVHDQAGAAVARCVRVCAATGLICACLVGWLIAA